MLSKCKAFLCGIIFFSVFMIIQGGFIEKRILNWSNYSSGENRYILGEMTDGTRITQIVPTKGNKITSIGICFASFGDRENNGEIILNVIDSNGINCGEKVIEANSIRDNEFLYVDIHQSYKVDKYVLNIQAIGSDSGASVSIWTSENNLMKKSGGNLTINGETFSNQIELVLEYEIVAWGKIVLALICTALLSYFLFKC